MRLTGAFLIVQTALGAPAFADEPKQELVKVYCFSEDLKAGFEDDAASFYCKELGKRGSKHKSLEIVETEESASVIVQFLGEERISEKGEATYLVGGYAWTPEQIKTGVRALVSVGEFKKGFHAKGVNDAAYVGLRDQVEEWIRENRNTIIEKAREKK